MRKLLIFTSVLAIAAPAAAQHRYEPADDEIVRSLPHPGEIHAMGETLSRVTDALMDVEVGPVVDAVDPARRLHRRHHDETLGDIASRDDPYARERMHDSIAAATIGIGAMVDQLAVMTPVLRRSIEDSRRRVEDAIRDGRERRYDRYHDREEYYDRDPDYDR
jgi:hypothetical protein